MRRSHARRSKGKRPEWQGFPLSNEAWETRCGLPFRAVTWNCRGGALERAPALWDYLVELFPDIAVLQEVSRLPESVRNSFAVRGARTPGPSGRPQSFQSVLLVRGTIGEPVRLRTDLNWVNLELEYFAANLMAYKVQVGSRELNVMGAYSPAWPLSRERLAGEDLSGVKLEHSPDVWVVDLVVAAMREELHLLAGGSVGHGWRLQHLRNLSKRLAGRTSR